MAFLIEVVVHHHALNWDVVHLIEVSKFLVECIWKHEEVIAVDLDELIYFRSIVHFVFKYFFYTFVHILYEIVLVCICLLVEDEENVRRIVLVYFHFLKGPAANLKDFNCLFVNFRLKCDNKGVWNGKAEKNHDSVEVEIVSGQPIPTVKRTKTFCV